MGINEFILNYPKYELVSGGGQFDWSKEDGQKIFMAFDSLGEDETVVEILSLVKHREWPVSDDPQEFEGKTEIEIIFISIDDEDWTSALTEDDRTELEYIVYQNL